MSIVIGLAPGDEGEAAARLGGMLARSAGEPVVVVSVTPTPWPPDPSLDEEYRVVREESAGLALQHVRTTVLTDVDGEYVIESARSVASGLIEVAQQHSASFIVLGSARRGLVGRVSLGGVAERILHSLDTPVCFAPIGFGDGQAHRVARVTVGFGRGDHDSGLLTAAARQADRLGIRLRVACFAVRPSGARGRSIEADVEDLVIGEWMEQVRADIGEALVRAEVDPRRVEIVIGAGSTWEEALTAVEWSDGDLLAIGASTSPVSRFFLGSHASKILRNSPVPVLVVARS